MTNSSTSIHKFWQPFDCFCIPKTDIHKYFISISKIRIFQTFGKRKSHIVIKLCFYQITFLDLFFA